MRSPREAAQLLRTLGRRASTEGDRQKSHEAKRARDEEKVRADRLKEKKRRDRERGLIASAKETAKRIETVGASAPTALTYHLAAELAQRFERGSFECSRLSGHELRVFSQNGEDGVIAELMRRTSTSPRYFVEFGVDRGTEGNAVFLSDVLGTAGLFIEGDPGSFAHLRDKYRWAETVTTLEGFVTPSNVETLFRQAAVPTEPDLLSVDVDGNDYWVWEAIESYSPRIVVIEYNSALDPSRRLVQPYTESNDAPESDFFGASLGALRSLGETKGYTLVHTDLAGVNAFFVRSDLEPALNLDAVAVRSPNYFLKGMGFRRDPLDRPYVDLDG